MLSLKAVTYVVSRDDHIRRLSRRSCTSSLEAVLHVVSRGSHVRRLSWLRDAGYVFTVRAQRVVKGFSLSAIFPFSFEVGCKSFFGQLRMHVCVTFTHVHVHVYT